MERGISNGAGALGARRLTAAPASWEPRQSATAELMTLMRLTEGGLHEPDPSDWDDVCATIGPNKFFGMLFREVGGLSLGAAEIIDESEDDLQRVRHGICGTAVTGARIEETECTESSDLPTYCRWETHGLPGMTVTWRYALEYAGQLGHVGFRHIELLADFEDAAAAERLSEVWRLVFGIVPTFEPT